MSQQPIYERQQNHMAAPDEPGRTPGQAEGNVRPTTEYDPAHDPGRTPGQAEGEPGWVGEAQNQSGADDHADGMDDFARVLQEQFDALRNQFESLFQESKETARREPGAAQNLQMREIARWASLMGGFSLAIYGLRRSLGSITLIGLGTGMVYYALTGRRPLRDMARSRSAGPQPREETTEATPQTNG